MLPRRSTSGGGRCGHEHDGEDGERVDVGPMFCGQLLRERAPHHPAFVTLTGKLVTEQLMWKVVGPVFAAVAGSNAMCRSISQMSE